MTCHVSSSAYWRVSKRSVVNAGERSSSFTGERVNAGEDMYARVSNDVSRVGTFTCVHLALQAGLRAGERSPQSFRGNCAVRCECCGTRLVQVDDRLICPQPACPDPTTIRPGQLTLDEGRS